MRPLSIFSTANCVKHKNFVCSVFPFKSNCSRTFKQRHRAAFDFNIVNDAIYRFFTLIFFLFFLCRERATLKQNKIGLDFWPKSERKKETMQLLKTSKCCGCMDLRTGGLVIGYLSLFGTFINLEAPNGVGIGPFGKFWFQLRSFLTKLPRNSFDFILFQWQAYWHTELGSMASSM